MKKFLPRSFDNPQGFTLIELMVVITIIAILAVVSIALIGNNLKSARDARRVSDIQAIGTAMEQHYNNSTASGCTSGVAGQYCALAASFFASNTVPGDPLNSTNDTSKAATSCNGKWCGYCIKAASGTPPTFTPALCVTTDTAVAASQPPAGSTYMVCANLEVAGSGPGGKDYICVQNQQQ